MQIGASLKEFESGSQVDFETGQVWLKCKIFEIFFFVCLLYFASSLRKFSSDRTCWQQENEARLRGQCLLENWTGHGKWVKG